HRRRALAQVRARDLAGVLRLARAVEDVVRDLERDPEREPVVAERALAAGAEQAGRLEQLAGLERAALEVGLDRGGGIVHLPTLQRLTAGEAEAGVGEVLDGVRVAGRGELAERAREQVVAGGERGVGAERRPGRRRAAAHARAVDEVVVHECRHVHELDGDAGGERRLVGAPRRGEEAEERPQPLAACRQRRGGNLGGEAWAAANGLREPHLELVEIAGETGRRLDRRERAHAATPVWSATIEPPSRR